MFSVYSGIFQIHWTTDNQTKLMSGQSKFNIISHLIAQSKALQFKQIMAFIMSINRQPTELSHRMLMTLALSPN